ncbi:hypothetical protein Leryth_005753 [Lithospermum erythrorhizon]|uniref:DNA-binding transcription factor n=1 Tax=Lithospermum erythrorhizon TaxID=34254 RepID=A0AAV3QYD0_LITER|nr:hypothetical protein Leryth_005753 [Lithospermum erythrorhizon]
MDKRRVNSIKEENEAIDGYESGTEEDQENFKQELEVFHSSRGLIFKPPKFYQEEVNLLKLWRLVTKHGGYEQVTSSKLWRQIGECFNPPKTCTMLAYAFRGFYEKALMEYEKHKINCSNSVLVPNIEEPFMANFKNSTSPISSKYGRPPRNSAIRAKKVWQSLRVSSTSSGDQEIEDPFVANKNTKDTILMGQNEVDEEPLEMADFDFHHVPKNEPLDEALPRKDTQEVPFKTIYSNPHPDLVKVNVFRNSDGFEIYALVPGLSQEEIKVQSDPAGYILITGQPKDLDNNPWGLSPFKKIMKLPMRINPHKTNAVATLHGQLFIRAPLESSEP